MPESSPENPAAGRCGTSWPARGDTGAPRPSARPEVAPPPFPTRSEIVTTDGARLHVALAGTGPCALLLLHGMGGSAHTWEPLLAHLDPLVFRTAAVDLRGHGRSRGGEGGFTFPQIHADLLAGADAAGMRRPIVVSFSGSAKHAAWLAAKAPERVAGLVLVAPGGMGCLPLDRATLAATFDHIGRHGAVPPAFDGLFTEKIGGHRAAVDRAFATTPRAALDASAELWVHTAVEAEVAGIAAPALIVAGARDALYAPEFQRRATLPSFRNARMEVLNCGHYIPYEEPAALAALVRDFCAGNPA